MTWFACDSNSNSYSNSNLQLDLYLDTETLTLQDMVDRVLKQRLGINEPTVSVGSTTLLEEGEGAEEGLRVNLQKLVKVRDGMG